MERKVSLAIQMEQKKQDVSKMVSKEFCIVKEWVDQLNEREQIVLLCSLREPDYGGSYPINLWVRYLRHVVLDDDSHVGNFKGKNKLYTIKEIIDQYPLTITLLSVNFIYYFLNALKIISKHHPDIKVKNITSDAYNDLQNFLNGG